MYNQQKTQPIIHRITAQQYTLMKPLTSIKSQNLKFEQLASAHFYSPTASAQNNDSVQRIFQIQIGKKIGKKIGKISSFEVL
jgi:hypothetical protein